MLNTKTIPVVLIRYCNNLSLQKKEGRKEEGRREEWREAKSKKEERKEKSSKRFTYLGST